MPLMLSISDIFNALGRTKLSQLLGVVPSALSNAENAGIMPASWYAAVSDLAREKGVDCPRELFNFKQARTESKVS